ncbi:hypothetical protein [Planococcus salinus]|uniref:Phospholipid phosphatase n=1 Tax=Planococcus salinus TaxID=1848460 RepID=A0A3M8P6U1_9BACL|nr:hypothetical protein [Planococcus salinus]RNF39141.1 hypothetical protein EEX84_10590 [Planococcus salinus]
MDTILFFLFTAAYIGLLIWALSKQRSWNLTSFLYLVLLGLIYDNAIIASGRYIGEGPLLENLSFIRFWSHALLTPTLALFSLGALRQAGVGWAKKKAVFYVVLGYTLAMIAVEFVFEVWGLELMVEKEYGLVKYASADPASGPPIMILLVTIVLIATGILLWKHIGWKWMLIGAGVMTIGSFVPIPVDSAAVTNAFELFLLFTLVWTKITVESKEYG